MLEEELQHKLVSFIDEEQRICPRELFSGEVYGRELAISAHALRVLVEDGWHLLAHRLSGRDHELIDLVSNRTNCDSEVQFTPNTDLAHEIGNLAKRLLAPARSHDTLTGMELEIFTLRYGATTCLEALAQGLEHQNIADCLGCDKEIVELVLNKHLMSSTLVFTQRPAFTQQVVSTNRLRTLAKTSPFELDTDAFIDYASELQSLRSKLLRRFLLDQKVVAAEMLMQLCERSLLFPKRTYRAGRVARFIHGCRARTSDCDEFGNRIASKYGEQFTFDELRIALSTNLDCFPLLKSVLGDRLEVALRLGRQQLLPRRGSRISEYEVRLLFQLGREDKSWVDKYHRFNTATGRNYNMRQIRSLHARLLRSADNGRIRHGMHLTQIERFQLLVFVLTNESPADNASPADWLAVTRDCNAAWEKARQRSSKSLRDQFLRNIADSDFEKEIEQLRRNRAERTAAEHQRMVQRRIQFRKLYGSKFASEEQDGDQALSGAERGAFAGLHSGKAVLTLEEEQFIDQQITNEFGDDKPTKDFFHTLSERLQQRFGKAYPPSAIARNFGKRARS